MQWKQIIAAMALSAVALTGCGGSNGADQATAENSPAQEPLKIGLLRIDDSLPFFAAEAEGLFEKHGVAVELVEFKSGKDQSIALESGELDGLMTDMVVQGLVKKSGVALKTVAMALGADAEEGRFLVVSAPESGIVTPADLAGKTVAISNNTMMDYLFETFEETLGLDSASINKVNMPDLMLRVTTLLEGKDIDAAILPDPLAAYAVLEGAHVVIDDTALGANLSQSVVAVTDEALANAPEEVAKLIAAYNEAIDLINNQPENYRELCLEKANVPEALAASYPMPTFTAGVVPGEHEVQLVIDWLVSRQLIDTAYAYEEMVDTRFVTND